jgi:hypothetical protein
MSRATDPQAHEHKPGLSADIYPTDEMVIDLTDSLRPRLTAVPSEHLESRVRITLEDLAPVHVTAYLGILVERRLRSSLPA